MRGDLLELGCEPGKISVIPMGVNLQHHFVPSKEPPCAESLLFVGRLVEKKGLRYLLEAMPKIAEQFSRVHLTVVGDGPCRRELEKLSLDLDLRGRVKFLGALRNDELPRVYQRAGIVVFPSVVSDDGDREGFGLVLVEAMGCGCATVVSDLPAMQDIVIQGKNGIVVAQKDAKGISQAVNQLMKDPKLSDAMAREGRATVLNCFDWGIISTRYANLLKCMATDG
jgi:glycosyltransferase involved in cell wall biosynthesis